MPLKYFQVLIVCYGRAFQRYIRYGNPTIDLSRAIKNILKHLSFGQTLAAAKLEIKFSVIKPLSNISKSFSNI